jgi:hypothetical protein
VIPDATRMLERIERLERSNRRLKRMAVVPLLAFAAIMVMGQAPARSKVIEAERFALVDSSGNLVGGLAAGERGPALTFFDATGVRLSLSQDAILLYDRQKEVRFMLRIQDEGTAGAVFYDPKGADRIHLRVAPDGRAGILVNVRDGKPEILGGR